MSLVHSQASRTQTAYLFHLVLLNCAELPTLAFVVIEGKLNRPDIIVGAPSDGFLVVVV